MSAGPSLPKTVFGQGFLLNRGVKMSKSDGNVVDPADMANRFGVDRLRWFLLRGVAFGEDGSCSDEAIIKRTNADLANGIGTLAKRALSMVAKNLSGAVPGPGVNAGADALTVSMISLTEAYFIAMNGLQLHRALEAVRAMVTATNGYFADNALWKLAKTDGTAMGHVLNATLDATRRIVLLVQPFMPEASARLLDLLGFASDARNFNHFNVSVATGSKLPEPRGVFPRWVKPA